MSHNVPNPITCPISWRMTSPRSPCASRESRSSVSSCIAPTIVKPPLLRMKQGPAEPRMLRNPSMGTSETRMIRSSTVSFTAGEDRPQDQRAP